MDESPHPLREDSVSHSNVAYAMQRPIRLTKQENDVLTKWAEDHKVPSSLFSQILILASRWPYGALGEDVCDG